MGREGLPEALPDTLLSKLRLIRTGLSINLSTISDLSMARDRAGRPEGVVYVGELPSRWLQHIEAAFGEDFRRQLENFQWELERYEKQAALLFDRLDELLTNQRNRLTNQSNSLATQRTTIAFSSAKLQYISQNHLRGTAYVIVLFLPGIFVSVSTYQPHPLLCTTTRRS